MQKETTGMTPEEIELHWFKTVYQGDNMPQLTLRAVIMGSFLGGIMSLSNLYVGLKTGWGLGVAITACILSFTIYRTLHSLLPHIFKTEMSILENNCMSSTASAAGMSTGGTMVSSISAFLMITPSFSCRYASTDSTVQMSARWGHQGSHIRARMVFPNPRGCSFPDLHRP